MRAIWIRKHGGPEVLEVRETPELPPAPKNEEVASAAPSAAPAAAVDPHKPAVKAAARRVSCDPPYTLDAHGIKVYKRECLK